MKVALTCCCGASIEAEWNPSRSVADTLAGPKIVKDFEERHAECRPPSSAPGVWTSPTADEPLAPRHARGDAADQVTAAAPGAEN